MDKDNVYKDCAKGSDVIKGKANEKSYESAKKIKNAIDSDMDNKILKQAISAEEQIDNLLVMLDDDEFREKHIYNNSEITEAIIRRYLLRLKGNNGVATLGASIGSCAVAPVRKPKTLEEAKAMAEIFISK